MVLDIPEITKEQLTEAVIQLATEYPDVVYGEPGSSCYYATTKAGDGVGCIFGQALQRLGVSKEVLLQFEANTTGGTRIEALVKFLGIPHDSRWDYVQAYQDRQVPWREAVLPLTHTATDIDSSDVE